MLKQKLQQKLLQKLSPQQIQMIKLLEIPSMQLEQRIKAEIEENPALEEGDIEETSLQKVKDRKMMSALIPMIRIRKSLPWRIIWRTMIILPIS